jgi:hypothetical protein
MMTSRRSPAVLILVLVLLFSAAGCADGSSDDEATQSAGDSAGEGALTESGDSPTGAALAAGARVQGERREVIYTADLVVRVDDAEAAAERAGDIASASDGYVGQQSSDLDGDRHVSITLRVPAAEFDGLLDELTSLGEVIRKDLDSQDVTDQVVDLERRIANARVSADRLRELLAEADGVPNVLAIETELTKRETEIEVMSGQLQVVRDSVDLSTLTVAFTEESDSDPAVADDLPGFVKAFKSGAVAVANIGLGLLAVIGFVLPFLPFLALAWFGHRWFRKRRPKAPKTAIAPAPLPGWTAAPGGPGGATDWNPPAAPPPPPVSAPGNDATPGTDADADRGGAAGGSVDVVDDASDPGPGSTPDD